MYIVERKFAERVERKIEILEMEYNRIIKQGVVLEDRLQEAACEIYRLREALHQISLASQNSMDSKEGCGKIARKALGENE